MCGPIYTLLTLTKVKLVEVVMKMKMKMKVKVKEWAYTCNIHTMARILFTKLVNVILLDRSMLFIISTVHNTAHHSVVGEA